jgi:very-short-patch-repair endonuclease
MGAMRKDPLLQQRARALRRDMTPTECILWSVLRDRRFAGFKFRRQKPIGGFIVDFVCAAATLVVELDGESHIGKEKADQDRKTALERMGYKVLRFWDTDVYDSRDAVLEVIWRECQTRAGPPLTPNPSPLSTGERGEERPPCNPTP